MVTQNSRSCGQVGRKSKARGSIFSNYCRDLNVTKKYVVIADASGLNAYARPITVGQHRTQNIHMAVAEAEVQVSA